jgi:hypothetical protein
VRLYLFRLFNYSFLYSFCYVPLIHPVFISERYLRRILIFEITILNVFLKGLTNARNLSKVSTSQIQIGIANRWQSCAEFQSHCPCSVRIKI